MTPEVFGEWLLLQRLGGRSMSEVFLAVRLGDRSGRLMVIKRPRLGERAAGAVAEALRREAEVLGERRWPGVATLDASGDLAGLPYVAIEHVRGVPLDKVLGGAPLSEAAWSLVARDLARTLAELHEQGWVHGDVAPSNVLVDDAGELVLVDFGLARRSDEARSGPSGKPGYASPDAALGRPARAADDVYAWGALVAECITGQPLFSETDLAEAATRRADLPADVAAHSLVARALSLDAAARPLAKDLVAIPAPPAAREELAERARRGAEPVAASEVVVAASAATPPPVVAPPRVVEAVAVQRTPVPTGMRRSVVAALVAAFLVFGLFGFFAGRRTAKNQGTSRDGTITIPTLPARTQVQIDGRTVIVPEAGRPFPISAGRHTITISLPREEREYDIFVQPGDHVVLVPIGRTKVKKE